MCHVEYLRSLTERCQQDPQVLSLPGGHMNGQQYHPDKTEVERKIRKDYKVCTVKEFEDSTTPIDCTKFSKWGRLVRVTA